jgi:hypothetical protein
VRHGIKSNKESNSMTVVRAAVPVPVIHAAPPPAPRGRLANLAAVGTLLLLTIGLRTWGLPGGGPIAYDEGWAAAGGRFLIAVITHPTIWLRHHGHIHVFPFGNDWKFGHDLTLGGLLAAGVSPENLTWLSAAAGAVMVVVLAALAYRRWGAPAAAVAGVVAGAVPLSINYGHRIVAEAVAMAGVAIVLYLIDRWWTARPSRLLAIATVAALLATLSLSYRLIATLLPIAMVLAWLGWRYRRHDLAPTLSTGQLMRLCLVPTAGIVIVYLLIPVGAAVGLHLPTAFSNQFIRSSAGAPLPFASPDFYLRTFWDFGGPIFVAAACLGLAAAIWRWKSLDPLAAIALGSLVGTFLFFSAAHEKAPRVIVICIPFAALLAARATTLLTRTRWRWPVALTVCAACLVTGWAGSGFTRELSGTGQAGRWLAAHPGAIAAVRAPVYAVYTERTWDPLVGVDPDHTFVTASAASTVQDLRGEGVRWAVVDGQALLVSSSPVYAQLLACGQPTAEFNDPADWTPIQTLEAADTLHLGYGATLARRDRILSDSGGKETIRIYDLAGTGTARCP